MNTSRAAALLSVCALVWPAAGFAADPAPAAAATVSPATTASVSVAALQARQASKDPALFVLDVRSADEYAAGHVPGAVNVPYDQVTARIAELPKDREIVLYCRSGRRAGIAAEVLVANGFRNLALLTGDMPAWEASGNPVEKSSQAQ